MRLLLAVMLLVLPAAAFAQETRVPPEGHVPPPATIAEAAWMEGQWSGTGIGGHPSMESWLPAVGGTMVGTFVQADGEGSIQFTEHMYLMEDDGSLVLRVKHFNPDFTGWEDAAGMINFRLIEIAHCAAYFAGLTIRCNGDDGLLVAVRMRSSAGETSELVFDYARAG